MNDDLFDHPERVLSWLSEHTGELFMKFVNDLADKALGELTKSDELTKIYRAQGEFEALKTVLNVEMYCRSLIEDKKTGKRS
jgi:hypothetical protein